MTPRVQLTNSAGAVDNFQNRLIPKDISLRATSVQRSAPQKNTARATAVQRSARMQHPTRVLNSKASFKNH